MRLHWLLGITALTLFSCRKHAEEPRPLRLGLFANITQAQALVGDSEGSFARALAPTGGVELKVFQGGSTAMEALLSGSLDASYVGTGPAVNAYVKSQHRLRVIAGAVDGGASLVVRHARSPADLRHQKLAAPQIGNTQDIALRSWLKATGLDPQKDVTILPLANPEILNAFSRGELEGAWVPEPWAARMVEAGGHILVDERSLWPEGRFQTTILVASTDALEKRRPALQALVAEHAALTRDWQVDPEEFRARVGVAFAKLAGGKGLSASVLRDAFSHLSPALYPDEHQLEAVAQQARALGYLPTSDIRGIVDTSLLP